MARDEFLHKMRQSAKDDGTRSQDLPERKVDLSPLFALADTWYGGNLSAAYKRPRDPEQIKNQQVKNKIAMEKFIADYDLKNRAANSRDEELLIKSYMANIAKQRADDLKVYGEGKIESLLNKSRSSGFSDEDERIFGMFGSTFDDIIDNEEDLQDLRNEAIEKNLIKGRKNNLNRDHDKLTKWRLIEKMRQISNQENIPFPEAVKLYMDHSAREKLALRNKIDHPDQKPSSPMGSKVNKEDSADEDGIWNFIGKMMKSGPYHE